MKTVYGLFAARRYWKDEAELQEVSALLSEELGETCVLISEPEDLVQIPEGQVLVAIPLSGAVQSLIIAASEKSQFTILLAGYVNGVFPPRAALRMLEHNAAPTVMDCWAVLRRAGKTLLAVSRTELDQSKRAAEAAAFVRQAKLLLVGEPEPWVISVSRNYADYTDQLGVTIQQVEQKELEDLYHSISDEQAESFINPVRSGADSIQEPNDHDLLEAGRMGAALETLTAQYEADGVAVACFSLLETGTTACLGVSRINDGNDNIAACEGDLDSACTMLLLKKLAKTKLWMANPSLQADGTVSFSHCTAPLNVCGEPCAYALRSHHESGIGVSPEVSLPQVDRLTASRFSVVAGAITIQNGVPVEGPREPTCRTQLRVRWDDPDHYLRTALGCHQVFAFEDLSKELELAAELLGISIL